MADTVQFDVDDTSPSVSYFPFADTFSTPNLLAGWNPYYNISGFDSAPGETGNGTSLHLTGLDGASLSLQWHGTGIQLFGNATQANYTITLDGTPTQPNSTSLSDNILASFEDLVNTNHSISLIARTNMSQSPDSFIAFDRASIITPPPDSPANSTFTMQSLMDTEVAFSGAWTFENDSAGSFHQSTTLGDSARSQFIGTAFFLTGTTSPNSGQFSVTLDGTVANYSAQSSFLNQDTLLFFASGLDPESTHQVEVLNTDGSQLALKVGGFAVISMGDPTPPETTSSPQPTPSPSPTIVPDSSGISNSTSFPKGTIAALALAGVLAFVVITGFLFYFFVYRPRRRRKRSTRRQIRRKEQEAGVVIDIGPNAAGCDEPESRGKRGSGRTGFARWRDEVEGGFGGLGLGGLGLAFRHSASVQERAPAKDAEIVEVSRDGADGVPLSSKSSEPTTSSKREGSKRSKGKGKKKNRGKDVSPSFTIDLPLPTFARNSRSRSNSGSQANAQSPTQTHHPSGSDHSSSHSDLFLSYISTPPRSPKFLGPDSHSTSESFSNRNSNSNSTSNPPKSTPQSRSRSPTPPVPPLPPLRRHIRDDSAGLLLHHGAPNPGSPDDEYKPRPLPIPGFQLHPPQSLVPGDRGSVVGEYGAEQDSDTMSILGTTTTQVAVRALSPRTSEAQSRQSPENRSTSRRTNLGDEGGRITEESSEPGSASPPRIDAGAQVEAQREPEHPSEGPREGRGDEYTGNAHLLTGPFLNVRQSSPFRVDFAGSTSRSRPGSSGTGAKVARLSGLSHVRFQEDQPAESEENEGKGKEKATEEEAKEIVTVKKIRALPPIPEPQSSFRLTPPPTTPMQSDSDSGGVTSFLDFGGSEGSILTQSNEGSGSGSSQRNRHSAFSNLPEKSRWSSASSPSVAVSLQKKSRWSNATTPSSGTNHDREAESNSGASVPSPSSGHPSSNFPFPVSLPPSPHHPPGHAQPRSQSASHLRVSYTRNTDPMHSHPTEIASDPTSPTDSIPMSVSDIHFRHTDSEEAGEPGSRRTSSGSHLPPHPPLPGLVGGLYDQHEQQIETPPPSAFLVQRVLGMHSPSSAGTPRFGHSRSASGLSAVPLTPAARDEYNANTSSRATPSEDNRERPPGAW